MQWNNPGMEFAQYNDVFKNKKIVIYGAGIRGKNFTDKVRSIEVDCVKAFIDNNLLEPYKGIPLYTLSEVSKEFLEDAIIVLAATERNMLLFAKQLRRLGLKEGINFFFDKDFLSYYITLYFFFAYQKTYAHFISMQISTVCNLRCKGCAGFSSYNKNQRHYTFEESKNNIDALFGKIDYIDVLDLAGGEPFLSESFIRVIDYAKVYRNRVNRLRTVTNGTTIPSDELCKSLKSAGMMVILDDYRHSVEMCNTTFELVKTKMEAYGIPVEIRKADRWIDFGIESPIYNRDDKAAIRQFDECANIIRSVHNHRLYCCDYADFAREAGCYKSIETDSLDLMDEKVTKAMVMEFLMGYTTTGYCGMCKICNGGINNNRHFISVAEQMDNQ